jgi:acetoin utilization deacetylase AcuC-like enzyme
LRPEARRSIAGTAVRIFYTDHFVLPLPEGHRFPMRKYALLRERVVEAALVPPSDLRVPEAASDAELLRAHTPEYLGRVVQGALSAREVRTIGFPWSPELVHRSRRSIGATLEACRAALEDGWAVNLAGGTHHAFRGRGESYCVFNDSAVAALAMLAEGLARRVIVIDCDVHQGNGTAAILADEPAVFSFSIHGEKNFPLRKERSDLDVGLPDGTQDEVYLAALDDGLRQGLGAAAPDLAIYLAGADPYREDAFGRLALTKAGLVARDRLVFDHCTRAGVPVAVSMAGGYARRIEDTVAIHFQTVREAAARAGGGTGY